MARTKIDRSLTQSKIELLGGTAMKKMLEALPRGARNRVIRSGIVKGAMGISKTAKGLVRVDTGLLRRSLGYVTRTYKKSGVVLAYIGARRGFAVDSTTTAGAKKLTVTKSGDVKVAKRNPAKYAHLVERGTKRSRAYPFLIPAFDLNQAKISRDVNARMNDLLRKETAKQRARSKQK